MAQGVKTSRRLPGGYRRTMTFSLMVMFAEASFGPDHCGINVQSFSGEDLHGVVICDYIRFSGAFLV